MHWLTRPVILIGEGCRDADLTPLLNLGLPILTSWQAKDMIDNAHPFYFGSPGIYGQRTANKVFAHADQILAIGNRMSIWNTGYIPPLDSTQLTMVDVDGFEAEKFENADWIYARAEDFIADLANEHVDRPSWLESCYEWRETYPWLEPGTHDDRNGYINSYRFTHKLSEYLKVDDVIVTDMGTPLVCAHQVLSLKPPQRLMTSGGLGEMGCALPAAIGAAFARPGKRVICLHADGGMMLNLQELQTIVHHNLPVKIIVYRNESYLMIRHTQTASRMEESGVSRETGVSFPSYRHVALAFGLTAGEIRTWEDYQRIIPALLSCEGPVLVEYHMDPQQPLVPKLGYDFVDGKQVYSAFDDMSPHLGAANA